MVHVCAGATAVVAATPHPVTVKAAGLVPVLVTEVMLRSEPPVLVIVTFWLTAGDTVLRVPKLSAVAERMATGGAGTTGVTALDGADSAPAPATVTARTWKVYDVPLVSPVIVKLLAAAGIPVTVFTMVLPELTTISLLVIGNAVASGGVQLTVAWALPPVAVTFVGADGGETETSKNAVQSPVTASVAVQNRRFSMFHSVS